MNGKMNSAAIAQGVLSNVAGIGSKIVRLVRTKKGKKLIVFLAGNGNETILFSDEVLAHFEKFRQYGPKQHEAGGQLFANLSEGQVHVAKATGPNANDKRNRFSFLIDRWQARTDIIKLHKQGLHYVGDWHTHPEAFPKPSSADVAAISDLVKSSRHSLGGFLMVIVGTAEGTDGLYVGISDGIDVKRILPDY